MAGRRNLGGPGEAPWLAQLPVAGLRVALRAALVPDELRRRLNCHYAAEARVMACILFSADTS